MKLTPSATSSGMAGFTFYLLMWLSVFKLDSLAKLLHLDGWISSKAIIRWVLKNKALTLLFTEAFNFSVHGITQAIAVTFAIGGTVCNATMVFIVLPIINKIRGPKWLYGGIR
jgi:hypothetical protein